MVKIKAPLADYIKAFKGEIILMLRFYISSKRILKFENFNTISRTYYVDLLVACKAIENDLVVRICKFVDTSKNVYSFQKAILQLPKNHKDYDLIILKIQEFGGFVAEIRDQRRHTELAHLKVGSKDNDLAVRLDLLPAIKKAAEIVDLMNNAAIPYFWSDGRYEKYDLRKLLLESNEKLSGPPDNFF
jgi:hypothetical protein